MTAAPVSHAPGGVEAEQGWTRLHPLTPLLRAGRSVLVVGALFGQQGLRDPSLVLLLVVVALVVPAAALLGYISWRTTRYRIADAELQVNSGVLQKRQRRVPLARLQSVDVVRPLIGRALGLSDLRLEVAGGGDTEAPLAYLSDSDAQRLRARLLALAGGATEDGTGTGDEGPQEPPERVLVTVPSGVLITSVLLGAPAIIGGVLLVALLVTLAISPTTAAGLLVFAFPAVLGTGGVAVRRLMVEYGFTVAESQDGLRLRHGLLETRAQTIPLGRVQTVRVLRPLLWRRRGWVRLEVDVAGYAAGGGAEQQATTSALLPVAPADFADALVARVLGGPLPVADRPVPQRARWRAPLSARRLHYGLDDRHLVASRGILTTTTDAVPLTKVQSLRLTQGPWQRRLGLASVHADSAGRRLPGVVALHRDEAQAHALLEELTGRVRLSRRR